MASRRLLTQRGFSLIEVLIVMVIALVLLGMAVPVIRNTDMVSSDVRRLVADITRARSWARTTWRTTTVDLDATNGRWRVIDENNELISSYESDADGWRSLRDGVNFFVNGTETMDFVFDADGRCPEAASALLRGGSSTWIVSCSPLSGTVTAEPVN
jgi:prepilin-type N-terminal cleavage/methylation domain-containing protein